MRINTSYSTINTNKNRYVTNFKAQTPIKPKRLDLVLEAAKKALTETVGNESLNENFSAKFRKLVAPILAPKSKIVLKPVENILKNSKIKFDEEHLAKIKELYANQPRKKSDYFNENFLTVILRMVKEVPSEKENEPRFNNQEIILKLLGLHKKAPDTTERIISTRFGMGEPGYGYDTDEDVIKAIMRDLPPNDKEKIAYFAHLDPEKTVQELLKLNSFHEDFNLEKAQELAHRVYGMKFNKKN